MAIRTLGAATLDNVVITGGSGAIGLRYAQYCIERGARRIILLSRNGIEAETLKELAGQHHVEVSHRSATSPTGLRWPPSPRTAPATAHRY